MKNTIRRTPDGRRKTLVLATGLFVMAGCGGSSYDTVPVEGTITVEGDPPPGRGVIRFSPISVADGAAMRPTAAEFDATGCYRASAFDTANGLPPGKYRVTIECWERPPSMAEPNPRSYVDLSITSLRTSALTLSVPADHSGALQQDYDVKSAR